MIAGSYGDFSSQNFVNDRDIKNPVGILLDMANESFKAEQNFYLQIGMPEKFCKSAEDTTKLLQDSSTFREYQEELCLRVFGASHEEYLFLKYFYDSKFIKALSAQSPGQDMLKGLARDLLEYYKGVTDIEKEAGLEVDDDNGNIQSPPLPPDAQAFVEFLKEQGINLESPDKINVKGKMMLYLREKFEMNGSSARSAIAAGPYKDVVDQVQAYINSFKKVDNSASKNNSSFRGFSVLKLAQIQFVDETHDFKYQFDKFVNRVIEFIGNQLNVAEVPDDLREDLQYQIRNEMRFTIASKNKDITIQDKTYKSKGSSTRYGQLQGKDQKDILTLTYNELVALASQKNATFSLNDIKLQGDSKLIDTIFTPQIKDKIKKINENYDIVFEQNGDDIIISNERLYLDKNMFYNNMMKLKFDYSKYGSDEYARKNQKAFQADKETMSKIFYDTLRGTLQNNLIVRDNQAEVLGSFDIWWETKGRRGFSDMLDDNPTQIYEIASKSAQANVAGMLGETLMALFLSSVQIPGAVVKVLGQSDHGNGQAAVDLKIMYNDNKNNISTAGFQIKQYAASESGNKVDLYSETSIKLSSEFMRRYLEANYLEKIRSIFFNSADSDYWLTSNQGINDNSVENVSNILNSHLMYFMRYDEAQMKNGTFDELEQNNFYIINFRFIPASSLLILAAIAIAGQVELQMSTKKDFFFFSESTDHIAKQNNIMTSLIRYLGLKDTKEASKSNNLCEYMQNDFRLNFVGFSINFKQQLDSVLKNAK